MKMQKIRVHYTVLTQHTNHNNHQHTKCRCLLLLATGTNNVAPDTQQHANHLKTYFAYTTLTYEDLMNQAPPETISVSQS